MQFDIKTNILTQLLIVYGYVVSDIFEGFLAGSHWESSDVL